MATQVKKHYIIFLFFTTLIMLIQHCSTQGCAAGTYGPPAGGACTNCPTGTYRGGIGGRTITDCTTCPANTYQDVSGSSACKSCNSTSQVCRVGSSKKYPAAYVADSPPLIILPPNVSPANVKLGAILLLFLLTIVPVLATAICCFNEELCGLFDLFYSESHYLGEGSTRTKLKSGFGGVMSLLAVSLFLIVFSVLIVDVTFDNIITNESLSVNKQTASMPPIDLINATISFNGGGDTCTKANAIISVTGFSGIISEQLTKNTESQCQFTFLCHECRITASTQKISVQLTSPTVFSPAIQYSFSVPELGFRNSSTVYKIQGYVVPDNITTVFLGREKISEVTIRLFRSLKKGLLGGQLGAPWVQLFNSIAQDTHYIAEGLTSEFISATKGATASGLITKASPGVGFQFTTSLSPNVFLIHENLRQTLLSFIGVSVSLLVACVAIAGFIMVLAEYCKSFLQKLIKIRNKRKYQKEKEENQIQNVENLVGDVKLGDIELDDLDINKAKIAEMKQKEQQKQNQISDDDIAKKMIVDLQQEMQFLVAKIKKLDTQQQRLLGNNTKEKQESSENLLVDLN